MLYDDIIPIDNQRSRDRFEYTQDLLCFKNVEPSKQVENKTPIRINVENISYSGLGIVCSRSVNVGSLLVFNINNGNEIREMMLEVKWIKFRNGFHTAGCEFLALTRPDIYFLHEIITKIKDSNKA